MPTFKIQPSTGSTGYHVSQGYVQRQKRKSRILINGFEGGKVGCVDIVFYLVVDLQR